MDAIGQLIADARRLLEQATERRQEARRWEKQAQDDNKGTPGTKPGTPEILSAGKVHEGLDYFVQRLGDAVTELDKLADEHRAAFERHLDEETL